MGLAFESFHHTTLPFSASRHESTPPTPNVHTLPAATAGELRGPMCPPIGTFAGSASYLSFQSSVPLSASRHWMISSFPSRVKTYALSPTSTGDASPRPTLAFHFCVNSLGHVLGSVKPVTLLSRLGPRHWGQSCALAHLTLSSSAQPTITPGVRCVFLMA